MKRVINSSIHNVSYDEVKYDNNKNLYYYVYNKFIIYRQTEDEMYSAIHKLNHDPRCIKELISQNPEF